MLDGGCAALMLLQMFFFEFSKSRRLPVRMRAMPRAISFYVLSLPKME
jgi:hypothetical protein